MLSVFNFSKMLTFNRSAITPNQRRLSLRLQIGRNLSELPLPDNLPMFLLLTSSPDESEMGLSAIFNRFIDSKPLRKDTLAKANQYIYIPDKKILFGPSNGDLGALKIWSLDYDESTFIIKEEFLGIIEPMNERIGKDDFRIVDITEQNSENNMIPITGLNDLELKNVSEENNNKRNIFQQRRVCVRPGPKAIPLYLHLLAKKLPCGARIGSIPKLTNNSSEDFYTYYHWQDLVSIIFTEYYILQENELSSFFNQEMKKLGEFKKSSIFKKSVDRNNLSTSLNESIFLEYLPSAVLDVTHKVRIDQAFKYYVSEIKSYKVGPSITDGDRTIY